MAIEHPTGAAQGSLWSLRRFVRPRKRVEQCEMCSALLRPEHQHLLEPGSHNLICACDACALLFGERGETRYRRVPRAARALPGFALSDAQWESLGIPIGLAMFFRDSSRDRLVALYPSPAGPTESLLSLHAWSEIAAENPSLETMLPDVEALLVNRLGESRRHYIVPIDQCYRLVGLIRTHWRGFSGGAEVWKQIDRLFAELDEKAAAAGSVEAERRTGTAP